jgi:thiol-disulfide isomerase/thioredoxin
MWMRGRRAVVLALVSITAAVMTGCSPGPGTAESTPQPAPPSGSAAATVPERLDFTAKTVDGTDFSGATLAGKPVVFWFWTPWCPTCQAEAPEVAKVARDNPDVVFVGVSAQADVPAMKQFMDRYGTGVFPNIADLDGTVWQRFGVTGQPSFALVSRDGTVEMIRGPLSKWDLVVNVANLKH